MVTQRPSSRSAAAALPSSRPGTKSWKPWTRIGLECRATMCLWFNVGQGSRSLELSMLSRSVPGCVCDAGKCPLSSGSGVRGHSEKRSLSDCCAVRKKVKDSRQGLLGFSGSDAPFCPPAAHFTGLFLAAFLQVQMLREALRSLDCCASSSAFQSN